MENQSPDAGTEYELEPGLVPRQSLRSRAASTFTLGGTLLVASVLVPIGLEPITEWSWAAGLGLVGLGVVAVVLGLLGTYPRADDRAPWVARIGILCATVAGGAAFGLIATVVAGGIAVVTLGVTFPKPMGAFVAMALSMAGGLSLGFVLFGVARMRTGDRSDVPGGLLVAGGGLLFVPVLGELIRLGVGIGPPPWLVFLALGSLAIDTLVVGHSLRSENGPSR